MNVKRERAPIKKSRLENEVILAVVVLYALLSAALLAIHYAQPDDSETLTSSTSPSHARFGEAPEPIATELSPTDVHALLSREGYQEIRGLRCDGARYRASAIKGGESWDIQVDPVSRAISQTVVDAH